MWNVTGRPKLKRAANIRDTVENLTHETVFANDAPKKGCIIKVHMLITLLTHFPSSKPDGTLGLLKTRLLKT